MKTRYFLTAVCLPFLSALLHAAGHPQHRSEPLPNPTNVLARVLARASEVAGGTNTEKYAYEKRSVLEELNSRGEAIRSTEKTYRVVLIQGWPFSRLIKVQGQRLSEAQMRREDQREQEFRNKIAGRDLGKMARKRENLITPELIARYEFRVLSKETCQGRNAVVLEFKPRRTN